MSLSWLPKKQIDRRINALAVAAILVVGSYVRFVNLNWDQEHYLHPDERLYINASDIRFPKTVQELLSPESSLNPHMFYYGSLPLYLYVSLFRLFKPVMENSFSLLVFSRFVSALMSSITLIVFYFLAKKILSTKAALIAMAMLAFSVGSIQYSHFNTTESILGFFIVLLTLVCVTYLEFPLDDRYPRNTVLFSIWAGVIFGAAIATKITGVSFGIVPAVSFGLMFVRIARSKDKKQIWTYQQAWMKGLVIFLLTTAVVGVLGSPYNVIDYPSFHKEQEYMQGVILGTHKPPFTIIYEGTVPYAYQLLNVFPWIFTPLAEVVSIIGIGILVRRIIKNPEKNASVLIVLLWPLVYFGVTGSWYAKFSRYMVILLPFLCLYVGVVSEWLIRRRLRWGLSVVMIVGVIFLQASYAFGYIKAVYQRTNSRIEASEWIYRNLERGAIIATEHWDDGLPLPRTGFRREQFSYIELTVYDPDTEDKINTLVHNIHRADYVIFSSRRVFYSIVKNPDIYPFTSKFYEKLFIGTLGFELVHTEFRYPQLWGLTINDDRADESFQSYDHPPVYVFKNVKRYGEQQLKQHVMNDSG